MPKYRLSVSARRDLYSELNYLAKEASVDIALQYRQKFQQVFAALNANPGIGHWREDLTARDVRFFAVRPYLVVYETARPSIIVHAIVHGARDVTTVLQKRSFDPL